MATITLHLSSEAEQKLNIQARQHGETLEAYLEHVILQHMEMGKGALLQPPASNEEFERLLDELAEGPTLPHLPTNFSRADIYADHD